VQNLANRVYQKAWQCGSKKGQQQKCSVQHVQMTHRNRPGLGCNTIFRQAKEAILGQTRKGVGCAKFMHQTYFQGDTRRKSVHNE
jgi:hypothetical protein